MKNKFLLLITICFLAFPLFVSAHPGRTDKYGGHTDKSTGQYHIHNDDGTVTYTEKPSEPKLQTPPTPEPGTNPKEDETSAIENIEETLEADQPTTVEVDGETKPIQPTVDTKAVAESIKPDIYLHKNENTFYKWILYIVFFILTFIGLSIACSVCYFAFQLLEGKNVIADYLLSFLILFVILPALVGNAIFKMMKKIQPKEKADDKASAEDDFIK